MIMISKSIILSLLATSVGAASLRTTTLDQTTQPRKMKEIQSLVRQGQQQQHQLLQRQLQADSDFGFGFAEICALFEGIFEEADFTCTCNTDTNTLSCTSAEICDDETNATECGVLKLELDFTSDGSAGELTLDYTKVCFEFLRDAAEEYPDICIRLDADETGEEIESCEVEVENTSGTLTKCSKCELCTTTDSNEDGFHLDCSNIYAGAKTDGCVAEGGDGDGGDVDLSTNTSQENPIRIVQQRAATADSNQGSPTTDTSAAPLRWMTPVGLVVVVMGTILGF